MRLFNYLVLLCFTTALVAGNAYVAHNTLLYPQASEGSALGELIVASEVKELSKSGAFSEVEFTGFMPEGSLVVYEKAGFLIVGFEASNPQSLKVIGKKTDEFGSVWIHVNVQGFVKSDALNTSKESVLAQGKTLFQSKCGTCHALHAEHEFDANVWPSVLEAMSPQAGLSKLEKFSIEKYLQNFKH